jgi:ribonucleoside-diphosphate reductase alpha chain
MEILINKENGRSYPYEHPRVLQSIAFALLEVRNRTTVPPIPRDLGMIPEEIHRQASAAADIVREKLKNLTGAPITNERVHQIVEATLLEIHPDAGEAYGNYRQARKKARESLIRMAPAQITQHDGRKETFDIKEVERLLSNAAVGLPNIDANLIYEHACRHMQNREIRSHEIPLFLAKAATEFISQDPDYDLLAARLKIAAMTLDTIREFQENGVLPAIIAQEIRKRPAYPAPYRSFGFLEKTLKTGVDQGLVNPKLIEPGFFNFQKLEDAIKPEGDARLTYQGADTLHKRYFLKTERNTRYELPQYFFMRVAMGLSLNEKNPTETAILIYSGYSELAYLSSTPTLFNSGLVHSQLASCYLQTVGDDLQQIFGSYTDHALMAKFAGGIGTDWTAVRARGSLIKGTNGESNGLVSWLKLAEGTTKAVNQGGKRKGACAAYLQNWHLDFLEFIQMRYPQGADELRIEQMNTVAWISDLYMKRVKEAAMWTLFCPSRTPELVSAYGADFENLYTAYENEANAAENLWVETEFTFSNSMRAKGRVSKQEHPLHPCAQINANELFKIHLSYLASSGHPWITFKDPSNICSPQDHVGVVHSSNLCTEIILNTRPTVYAAKNDDTVQNRGETAVCNLGSLNLPHYLVRDEKGVAIGINLPLLYEKIPVLLRMLDNVIDLNYYPIPETRQSNLEHRPVGLGVMGWHHFLQELQIPFDSQKAVELADHLHEHILFATLQASVNLAKEKGAYPSFAGSKWSRGILPQDTRELIIQDRGASHCRFHFGQVIPAEKWENLRQEIMTYGVRNSNHIAIAPTATIGKIAGGTSQGVDPIRENLYSETDLGGDYTRMNPVLVRILKSAGIWTKETNRHLRDRIVANNGSIQGLSEIPENIQKGFKGAMDIHPQWIIMQAGRRQKWIDQSASTNVYLDAGNNNVLQNQKAGPLLHALYILAWESGLKTTYYLLMKAATSREKTTVNLDKTQMNAGVLRTQQPAAENPAGSPSYPPQQEDGWASLPGTQPLACSLDNPDCEACQ